MNQSILMRFFIAAFVINIGMWIIIRFSIDELVSDKRILSPACLSGIFPLKEVKHGVEAQGLQIQNLPHKRAGNPDCEDDWMFAFHL